MMSRKQLGAVENRPTRTTHRAFFNLTGFLVGCVLVAGSISAEPPQSDIFYDHVLSEVQANTFTKSDQHKVSIAVSPDDQIIAVWASRKQELGSSGIYAQRVDAFGRDIGTELHINQCAPGVQTDPDIAINRAGHAWIVWESWESDGDRRAIIARRHILSGESFQPETDEIIVNTTSMGDQYDPSVSIDEEGRALITWTQITDIGSSGDSTSVVCARLFNSDGRSLTGELAISDTGTARISGSTALKDGRFAVTWASSDDTAGTNRVMVRLIDLDSENTVHLGEEFSIASDDEPIRLHIEPAIASDRSGHFVIAWMRSRLQGQGYEVCARRFSPSGSPVTGTIVVGSGEVVDPELKAWANGAAVIASSDGRFVVSFNLITTATPDTDAETNPQIPSFSTQILARSFNSDGSPVGSLFTLTRTTDGTRRRLEAAMNNHRLA